MGELWSHNTEASKPASSPGRPAAGWDVSRDTARDGARPCPAAFATTPAGAGGARLAGGRWALARGFGHVVTERRGSSARHFVECWIDGRRYRIRRIPLGAGEALPIDSAELADELLQAIRADIRNGKSRLQAVSPYLASHAPETLFAWHWRRFIEAKRRQGQRGGDGRHQRQLSAKRIRELEAHERRGHLGALLEMPIVSLSAGVLEDWRDSLFDRFELAPKTVANVVTDVGTCLHWLARRGELSSVPPLPRTRVPDYQPRIPTPASLAAILERIPWPLRGAFLARGYMGLRPSEAWRADVGDYDRGGRSLSVLGKGGRLRVLPADELVADWILDQVEPNAFGAAPLFANPRAGRAARWSPAASRRVWLAACRDAGVDFPENEGLRHAFGTHCANRGVTLDRVGAFMGHTSERTTRRYAKLSTLGLVDVLVKRD